VTPAAYATFALAKYEASLAEHPRDRMLVTSECVGELLKTSSLAAQPGAVSPQSGASDLRAAVAVAWMNAAGRRELAGPSPRLDLLEVDR